MVEQSRAPLLEALIKYSDSDPVRMHVPGHGGGRGAPRDFFEVTGPGIFNIDVTELPGLDDLNHPVGVIAQAQDLAAQAFGAVRSFFLVNGTTQGLHALIMAAGQPGEKVIMPRNIHRSVIGGMVLGGLDPVFVVPSVVPDFNFPAGVPADRFGQALEGNPDACAVLCVHPTYHGVVGDLRSIAGITHKYGKPLLADEAHGCHLYFHQGFPAGALQAGADAVVQSIHKTGGSLTQSSLLHVKGENIDQDRIAEVIKLIQTSSPSYLLMASIDAARRQLALKGNHLLQQLLESVSIIREELKELRCIKVFGKEHLDSRGIFDFDPSRLVIRVSGMGLTGYQASEWLTDKYGVYAEMADHDNIVLVPGLGVTKEECQGLAIAVKDLAAREGNLGLQSGRVVVRSPDVKQILGLRDAWFAPSREILIEEAGGCICAEWAAVYPPGIPVIVPGEEISIEMVNYLVWVRDSGAAFQGPADPQLKYIRVIS